MSLTYLRDVLPWSVAQPWFHVRLKFRSTAHLTWLETRDETAQTHEKPDPDLLETNNASFLHPHWEGHLIFSASVPAQMLIRCRGGNTPLRPAGNTKLLSSHCHSHTHSLVLVREMKISLFFLFFFFYLFGAVSLSATPGLPDTQAPQPGFTVMTRLVTRQRCVATVLSQLRWCAPHITLIWIWRELNVIPHECLQSRNGYVTLILACWSVIYCVSVHLESLICFSSSGFFHVFHQRSLFLVNTC